MNAIDGKILAVLEMGIPLKLNPFKDIADEMDITEEEVVDRIRSMIEQGIIRRIGARINHRNLGIIYNAMVVWKVPDHLIDKTGIIMAGYSEVTHCYERECIPGRWEYNVYTVLHGYSKEEVERHIRQISVLTGITDYDILYSIKELKRTPPGIYRTIREAR